MRWRRAATTAALLAVLLTAGCHDDGPGATAPRAATAATDAAPPTTDAALPGEAPLEVPGVTAILEQYREDEIQGLISVKTTNRSNANPPAGRPWRRPRCVEYRPEKSQRSASTVATSSTPR